MKPRSPDHAWVRVKDGKLNVRTLDGRERPLTWRERLAWYWLRKVPTP